MNNRHNAVHLPCSGGLGQIDHSHLHKNDPDIGMLIVKIGGPAYRIGMGGGAASSVPSGSNRADLDFNAVQVQGLSWTGIVLPFISSVMAASCRRRAGWMLGSCLGSLAVVAWTTAYWADWSEAHTYSLLEPEDACALSHGPGEASARQSLAFSHKVISLAWLF